MMFITINFRIVDDEFRNFKDGIKGVSSLEKKEKDPEPITTRL